jgi:hypothetical protein
MLAAVDLRRAHYTMHPAGKAVAPVRRPPTRLGPDAPARPDRRRLAVPVRSRPAALWLLPLRLKSDHFVAPADAAELTRRGARHHPPRDRPRPVPRRRPRAEVAGQVPRDRGTPGAVLQRRKGGCAPEAAGPVRVGLPRLRLVGRPSPPDARRVRVRPVQRPAPLPPETPRRRTLCRTGRLRPPYLAYSTLRTSRSTVTFTSPG